MTLIPKSEKPILLPDNDIKVPRNSKTPIINYVEPSSEVPASLPSEFTYEILSSMIEIVTDKTNRFQASLVLAGSFAVLFCSVGFVNAFGVFQEYYEETLLSSSSPSTISWIGSFNIFCIFGGALGTGMLNDKYGPRVCPPEIPPSDKS